MKCFKVVILLVVLFSGVSNGQQTIIAFDRSNDISVFNEDSVELAFPWTGGFNFCQFGEMDINNDGIKDIVVFDRSGDKVVAMEFTGTPGNPSYRHNYQAEAAFPPLKHFMILRDFNCDGKEDIFTFNNTAFRVYKNTSSAENGLQFSLYMDRLASFTNPLNQDIFTIPVDISAFEDMDNDNDLDLLVFNITGSCVEFHRNMAQEQLGRCDTLIMQLERTSWGRFTEDFSTNTVSLNDTCVDVGFKGPPVDRHAGSSMLVFDADGDGDKELLLGDISYRTLTLLVNEPSNGQDRITGQIANFPPNTSFVNLSIFPGAFYVDVDHDGKKDLIVSPNSETGSENNRCIWYYNNIGTAEVPVFSFIKNSLFVEETLDFGEGAIPAFIDYNIDGRMDLVVGNYGYFTPNGDYKAQIALLKNIGTNEEPAYQLINRNYANLGELFGTSVNYTPAFGDIDGDGDKDMLAGSSDGRLFHFDNIASPGSEANFSLVTPTFEGIDVGTYAAPFLVDVDLDGRIDVLVGTREGKVEYYRNTSNGASPVMELQTDHFGEITTALTGEPNGFSTPVLFRKGGVRYMICGSQAGYFHLYGDIDGNLGGAFTDIDSTFLGNRYGERTSITISDIDGDDFPDAVIGNYAGGLNYFKGVFASQIKELADGTKAFNVFPNPGKDKVFIESGRGKIRKVLMYDVQGRLIKSTDGGGNQVEISTEGLPKGIFVIQILSDQNSEVIRWIHQ